MVKKNKVFPYGLIPKKININKMFKRFINKLITYFDEPHEKLIFNILLIGIFSIVYKIIDVNNKNAFSKRLNGFDPIYFSSINSFTLGYGDILPQSNVAKIAVIIHSLMFWMVAIA